MVIALILIYDISSALLESRIAMKVILDHEMREISIEYDHSNSALISTN